MTARRSIRLSRRRLWGVVAAICIAMAFGTFSGGSSEFRIVHVRGSRVHIRTFVPSSLHHLNVRRHLYTGEAFYIVKERQGIAHTGHGRGIWVYVRGLSDPALEGWINQQFLAESGGYYSPDPPSKPSVTSTAATKIAPQPTIEAQASAPAETTASAGAPRIQWIDWILSILASVATLVALFVSFAGLAALMRILGLLVIEPDLVPIRSSVPVSTQHFIVGSGWKIRRTDS